MIVGAPSQTDVEATYLSGETGLLAAVEVRVDDNQGNTIFGPTNPDRELGTTGVYAIDLVLPAAEGQYTVLWSPDGSFDPATLASEDLLVIAGGVAAAIPPLIPPAADAGPSHAPCTAWTTSEAAAECCSSAGIGSDVDLLDDAVIAASEALYELSARQFPGVCIERTVRPCDPGPGCGVQTLPTGYVVRWDEGCWCSATGPACSCQSLSRILLPNAPVGEIVEVKIDGVVLDPDEYRLDGWQYLTRMADVNGRAQSWPACQRLDLDDSEDGTFAVRYLAGRNPPALGQQAAGELACQIYLSCQDAEANDGACVLPAGVTRVTRQGVTFDLTKFTWAFRTREGWKTGLPLVDLFLNAYNPRGMRRAPLIVDPAALAYPEELGTVAGS